jgi:hypothetical protein
VDEIAATKEDVQQGGVTAALATAAAVAMASLSPSLDAQTVTQSPVLMAPEMLPQKSWKCTDCRRLRAFGELLISLSLSLPRHKNNSSPERAHTLLLRTPLKGEEKAKEETPITVLTADRVTHG